MGLDANLILQGRQIQLDNPLDSYAKAMSLKQLALQNQNYEADQNKQRAVNDILRRSSSVDQNGQIQINKGAALKDLMDVDPEIAAEKSTAWHKLEQDQKQQIQSLVKSSVFSMTPENYSQKIQEMKAAGLPNMEMWPSVYDQNFVQRMQAVTLDPDKQMAQRNEDRNYNLKVQELGIKNKEAERKAQGGESLPLDKKKVVETLATKNATKMAIKNQIEAVMNTWDNLSDDQKVVQGRSLLKTLNSTEGADAIGAEEAKRLGGLLEFKVFNLTEPGSVIGRDLGEFKTQALSAAKNIGSAVESNQSQIDQAMGRKKQSAPTNKPSWAL